MKKPEEMGLDEKIKSMHIELRARDFKQALETILIWGTKAKGSEIRNPLSRDKFNYDLREIAESENPEAACKVCSSVVQYIIKTHPEFADVYKKMYEAGTGVGCAACKDLIKYSDMLLEYMLSKERTIPRKVHGWELKDIEKKYRGEEDADFN